MYLELKTHEFSLPLFAWDFYRKLTDLWWVEAVLNVRHELKKEDHL